MFELVFPNRPGPWRFARLAPMCAMNSFTPTRKSILDRTGQLAVEGVHDQLLPWQW